MHVDTSHGHQDHLDRSQGLREAPPPDAELFLSSVALGELAEGFSSAEYPAVRMVRQQHTLLPVDEQTALLYAGVVRDLRSRGMLIGANDLWIGATSLRFHLPIVTANVKHFRRIEGLEVVAYLESAAS